MNDFKRFLDEHNRGQAELFDPQNEPDKAPSKWCMFLFLACGFFVVAFIVFLAITIMIESTVTPVKGQELPPQKPGWITYHYALPMILNDTGKIVTTSTTTTSTSTTTTLREPLEWMSTTPNSLILNYTTQTIAITGTGFIPGMLVHVPLIGYLPVDVMSHNTGSFTIDKEYLTLNYFGVNPESLTCYLLLPDSTVSDYQFIKVIDPNAARVK